MVNEEQQYIIDRLISGSVTKEQFASMRSYARKLGNLSRSIELAVVFEVYKYRIKYGKERKT